MGTKRTKVINPELFRDAHEAFKQLRDKQEEEDENYLQLQLKDIQGTAPLSSWSASSVRNALVYFEEMQFVTYIGTKTKGSFNKMDFGNVPDAHDEEMLEHPMYMEIVRVHKKEPFVAEQEQTAIATFNYLKILPVILSVVSIALTKYGVDNDAIEEIKKAIECSVQMRSAVTSSVSETFRSLH